MQGCLPDVLVLRYTAIKYINVINYTYSINYAYNTYVKTLMTYFEIKFVG